MKRKPGMITRFGNTRPGKMEIATVPANLEPGTLAVRGSGTTWAVYLGSERITRFFTFHEAAYQAATAIEHRSRLVERPCLTCGEPMLSTGPHHRMCNICRETAQEIA